MGLVLMMMFCARTITTSMLSPWKSLLLFFAVPLGWMLKDATAGSQLMALDAIFAVGVVSLVYLYMLKRNHVLSEAFMVANLVIIAYGLLRFQIFGDYQIAAFDQGMELLKAQMPTFTDNTIMTQSLPIWKLLLPSVWIITQSLALLIGFLLFQKMLKIPLTIASWHFPAFYNFLIIAILPLFLFEQTKMLSINTLIALCSIPFLQGVSLMWQRMHAIFANRFVIGIFMIIIILYASVLLVLFGFADMWLNKRNTIPGGTTA
jgi:fumarate reductase subunit D